MALVTVTANNNRVDDSEAITGWSSRGGGAGASAEQPLAYQGSNTVNRKISSSTGAGFEYDPTQDSGTAQDMTSAANAHWMTKFIVSDAGGLRANDGVRIIVGDGANEYAFVTAGTDSVKGGYSEYLLRSATIICPVNPNISGYRDATHSSGTVTLTAVDQFGIDAEFATGTAKSENVGLDAIDLGTGLTMSGGDGADPDGSYQDFVDADEGTVNNRWGYASSFYGEVKIFFGQITIGSASATVFSDLDSQVLFPDGLFANGFSRVFCDLQNAVTSITCGSTITSLGTLDIEDTRSDFVWSGTAGTGSASHTLNNFRNYVLTSAVTVDGANIECADLTQSGATIQNATIRCNSLSGVAVCDDATFTDIDSVIFVQSGAGHALEITTAGTYTLNAIDFDGFGGVAGENLVSNSGALDAAIYNNSGGLVTLNIVGGASPSIRNGVGATTAVNNAVNVVFDNIVSGSRLYIRATSTVGSVTAGDALVNEIVSSDPFTYSHDYEGDLTILYRVRKHSSAPFYKDVESQGTITSAGFQAFINQILD